MKLDVFQWSEIPVKQERKAPQGRLLVRLSQPGAVYVTAQGYQALAGYGTEIDVRTVEEVTFWVDAPDKCRVFLYTPEGSSYEPEGEVFTNPDRMVNESGSVLEVKAALRRFQLEQRAMLSEVRREHAALVAAKADAFKADPDPKAEDKTDVSASE